MLALEKSLGHKPGYYDIACKVEQTLSDRRVFFGSSSCVQDMIWAVLEANKNNNQEEQEQARSEQGYYAEQSPGNYVWVDTRSGYQKFTDNWCRCSPGQAYMLNRAAKNYFNGAPMSGYEKFILRGTNINKVIKMYK